MDIRTLAAEHKALMPDVPRTFSGRVWRKALSAFLKITRTPPADPLVKVVVHGARLTLRSSHALPIYARRYPFYDTALPALARFVHTDRELTFVDVGANVGDTAAIVAAGVGTQNVRFICIEGDPEYWALLEENTRTLSAKIIHAIASDKAHDAGATFERTKGTSQIRFENGSSSFVRRLDDLLVEVTPDIIKIDTDGHESSIIRGAMTTLRRARPWVHIEVDEQNLRNISQSSARELFSLFKSAGYNAALLYDNYGYPLAITHFREPELTQIINYSIIKGRFYYDAVLAPDEALLERFYEREIHRVQANGSVC